MEITGYILNEKNQPLNGALLSWIDNRSKSVLFGPVTLNNAYYSIEIDLPQVTDDDYLKVSYPGYPDTSFRVLSFLASPASLIMQKQNNLSLLLLAGAGVAWALSDNKKKKVGAMDNEKVKTALLITGGVIGLGLVSKLFGILGLGVDPSAQDQTDPGSPWKPSYWQQFNSHTYAINQAQAQQYSKTIHDSFTVFQDDFNAIKSVFFALRTKANVSYLSYIFTAVYNEDLLTFLTNGGGILPWDGLSQSQMQILIDYVNNLPKN